MFGRNFEEDPHRCECSRGGKCVSLVGSFFLIEPLCHISGLVKCGAVWVWFAGKDPASAQGSTCLG
jgi:hypothetical protein